MGYDGKPVHKVLKSKVIKYPSLRGGTPTWQSRECEIKFWIASSTRKDDEESEITHI